MINALQIVVLLPLLQAKVPANTAGALAIILKIAAFEVFDVRQTVNEVMGLLPTGPLNDKFEAMGLESLYFINNMGTFQFYLYGLVLMTLLWLLLTPFICINSIQRLRTKLGNTLFWDLLVGTVTESFTIILLAGQIHLKHKLVWEDLGEKVQTGTCVFLLAVYTLIPVYILIKVPMNFKKLNRDDFKSKYGKLVDGLDKTYYGKLMILQPLMFFFRRAHFTTMVVLFSTTPFVFQIGQIMLLTFMTIFLQFFRSKTQRKMNRFSEVIILLVSYCFLTFNVVEVYVNFTLGYVPIVVVGIYIAFCLLKLVRDIVRAKRYLYKLWRGKKQLEAQRKQLRKWLDETKVARKERQRKMLRPTFADFMAQSSTQFAVVQESQQQEGDSSYSSEHLSSISEEDSSDYSSSSGEQVPPVSPLPPPAQVQVRNISSMIVDDGKSRYVNFGINQAPAVAEKAGGKTQAESQVAFQRPKPLRRADFSKFDSLNDSKHPDSSEHGQTSRHLLAPGPQASVPEPEVRLPFPEPPSIGINSPADHRPLNAGVADFIDLIDGILNVEPKSADIVVGDRQIAPDSGSKTSQAETSLGRASRRQPIAK